MKHFHTIEKFLAHPSCEIVQQLKFDLDLIEVSHGVCLSVENRAFIPCPIDDAMRGKISPRAFVPYDCTTRPEPGYFREAILNSFDEAAVRVNFLNKLYQCLMASKMPQKVRKLVVAGPRDSGKTSWANIFHRVVPAESIATITSERQFSAAMLTDDTQLVIVDEWSANTMDSTLAKTILQGGWMVTAVKHDKPRRVINNSPYYITTNNVPNFGEEEANVQRRIQVFITKSLPCQIPGIDCWIYDHAMDCIAWILDELHRHYHHISKDELWYEPNVTRRLTMTANEGTSLFEIEHVRGICPGDLKEVETPEKETTSPVIHERFHQEYRTQWLRRRRRQQQPCLMETDDEHTDSERQISHGHASPRSLTHAVEQTAEDENTGYETDIDWNVIESDVNVAAAVAGSKALDADASTVDDDEQKVVNDHTTAVDHDPSAVDDDATAVDKDLRAVDSEVTAPDDDRATPAPAPVDSTSEPSTSVPQQQISSPPDGWMLNSDEYFTRVAQLIKWSFYRNPSKALVHSFQERIRRAELRRTYQEKNFWVVADPTIDASLLMFGQKRDVFDMMAFVRKYPQSRGDLENLRKSTNVRVMPDRCPFSLAMEALQTPEPNDSDEEEIQLDEDGDPARPQIPSQSYWTKIKTWRPW